MQNSKKIIIVLLAIIVFVLIYMGIKLFGPENTENSVAPTTPLNGLYIFNKELNTDTSAIQKSQKQYAIVAGNFKYDKEKSYRGPKCGQGNINTYPCFFFTETTHGEVIEIAEWPNKLLFQKYSDILPLDPEPETSNLFINDSVRFSSNIIYFDTEYANGCATTYKQHWSFNIDTKEFIFNNQ